MLDWGDGALRLTLSDEDTAADAIAAETAGSMRVGAQVVHLIELLEHMDADRIRIGSNEPGAPIVVTPATGGAKILFLQMPCALRNAAAAA